MLVITIQVRFNFAKMYPVQYLNVYLGYHITSYLCKRGSSTAIKVYTKHGKHQFLNIKTHDNNKSSSLITSISALSASSMTN